MFSDAPHMTVLFAASYGLYLVAAGIFAVTNRTGWKAVIDGFENNPALMFVTGFIVFVLGIVMTTLHSVWTTPLTVVVSLVGWAALIKGLLFIAIPGSLLALSKPFTGPATNRVTGVIVIVLGAILLSLSGPQLIG